MINRLAELNRVLIAASTIAQPGDLITQASVVRQCETLVVEGVIPDHNITIQCAESMGFVILKAERMMVSDAGKDLLDLNPSKTYELTKDQKYMLLRNCYFSGAYRDATLEVLGCFTRTYDAQTFRWSEFDSSPMKGNPLIIEHLIQLGLLNRLLSILEVSKDYIEAVANLLTEENRWTPKPLEEWLAERNEIGEIAEELMLIYEKERVREAGGKVECSCISRVSKLRPDAGYDMESFNGKSSGMVYDRFVEVKGATGKNIRFFMSENEIKIARKLKDKYWIYFIGGIDKQKRATENKPILFQNPTETVLNNTNYQITPQGILVEKI